PRGSRPHCRPAHARRRLSRVGDAMNGRRLLLHQIGLEQRSFWRNPETAFFSFFLPVGLLLIFGAISSGDKIPGRPDLKALTIVLGRVPFGVAPPARGISSLAVTLTLGITCFAALGLAVSGLIRRADAAGAITNGTYLPLAMVSGTFSGQLSLPSWLDHLVSA